MAGYVEFLQGANSLRRPRIEGVHMAELFPALTEVRVLEGLTLYVSSEIVDLNASFTFKQTLPRLNSEIGFTLPFASGLKGELP
ncbi:hypothetical protein FRC18_005554 [Serendipita sp. 400]|nr:hypothetical protein FRC18_005554 [Serendipita sp. 400]